jgi:ligand-binding sensor domain-containing protein/signal transduction histidine kinase/DNA-binding response OmpR family regulator
MKKLCLVVFCIGLFSFLSVGSENQKSNPYLFRNISNSDGLSQSTVLSIVQDSMGYMWFGTQDGLNRYDGRKFKVYRNDKEDRTSVLSNYIRKLYVSNKGNLWVAGNRGVSLYNPTHDSFYNFPIKENYESSHILDITEDEKGTIYIGSANGNIYEYEADKKIFSKLELKSNAEFKNKINVIVPNEEYLLLGTNYGLFEFDKRTFQLKKIEISNDDIEVRTIKKDIRNGFWIGTEGDGLFRIDQNYKLVSKFLHSVNNTNSVSNDNIRSLSFDKEGKLWIGTFIGLSIYDPESGNFSNYYEEFSRPYALSQNSVRSIYQDAHGGMWLGTFFGGVNYYHSSDTKFQLINQNGSNFSLSDNVTSAIKEDKQGNLWIATNDKGLNYWDRKKNQIRYYTHNEKDPGSLSSNNLKSIVITDNGKLLVGTHKSGLNLLDPRTGKCKVFKHSQRKGSLADNSIYALLLDKKSRIWVGTWKGLNLFDPQTNSFKLFDVDSKGNRLSSDAIHYLFEDSRGRIWIGTPKGLNIFYPENNIFETFMPDLNAPNSLSDGMVTCITEDQKGRIWVGTKAGLNVFDEIERRFISYTTKDGLPNDVIYGVLEDEQERLWMSTNKGLSCFNPSSKKFKNYDLEDGIQSRQFNTYSFCKTTNGELLFGGINGITIFQPEQLRVTPFNDEVHFRNLKVNNKGVIPGDETGVLKKHISQSQVVVLKSNQNVFQLEYSAINYISANKVKYMRILEGFEDEWVMSSENMSPTYSNLSSGEYIFKVKAVSGEGVVGEDVASVNIVVLDPWYISAYAILVYVLIALVVLIISLRLLKERIRTQNELRVERLEKKKLTEINQMKLQFFTNITHEFRTPLTLILSPLQKIRERKSNDDWFNKQHDMIYKNTMRLLNLVDQLMDFRKSELGTLKLQVAKGEIVSFVNEIYLSFAEVASQNNIIYTFDTRFEKVSLYFDSSYVEKIIFNLLSNAFKFTPSGGSIGILINQSNSKLILEVSDSGKGIPVDQQSLIFERFYRIDENTSKPGSGIGLALTKRLVELHHGTITVRSEKDKGSKFIVSIPLNESVYSEEELKEVLIEESHKTKPVVDIYTPENELIELAEDDEKDSVLVVEDNPDIIHYLRENLADKYTVYSASNGEEALSIVSEKQPTLVISDVMMPVMDGVAFCKKIKQNIKTCHIPIILLTAKSAVEDQIDGLEMGADDYITKPFVMNLLEAKVGNIIKSRKRLKEYYSKSLEIQPEKMAFNNLDEELLKKAVEIVETNLSEPDLSVDFFAREMGMSRSNLHLKLKAITGESATDFIKKIRFKKATSLIEENKYSIAEISYMVGFNSPSYFSTSFKKYFGYLPTEYLQKNFDKK